MTREDYNSQTTAMQTACCSVAMQGIHKKNAGPSASSGKQLRPQRHQLRPQQLRPQRHQLRPH